MDAMTIARIAVTIVSMISFLVFVAVAYSRRNADTMNAMGQSIIDDEDYFEKDEPSSVAAEVQRK